MLVIQQFEIQYHSLPFRMTQLKNCIIEILPYGSLCRSFANILAAKNCLWKIIKMIIINTNKLKNASGSTFEVTAQMKYVKCVISVSNMYCRLLILFYTIFVIYVRICIQHVNITMANGLAIFMFCECVDLAIILI